MKEKTSAVTQIRKFEYIASALAKIIRTKKKATHDREKNHQPKTQENEAISPGVPPMVLASIIGDYYLFNLRMRQSDILVG